MNLLLLGRGKTGSLVAEVAAEYRHHTRVIGASENTNGSALSADKLHAIDAVIDFTAPHCVLANIEACVKAGKNMIVGTTGWHHEIDQVRALVERHNTGFVYAANFSIGVNLFYDIARTAAAALNHDYTGQIFERHHAHKKDAPSGSAIALQNIIHEIAPRHEALGITSFREGEVIGFHEVIFESGADRIYLSHDAKSRRGFAQGAIRAAEWLVGKQGFYDFKNIWREL
jgi:4-hydroxy-tetrahydrodipicolinate reductase